MIFIQDALLGPDNKPDFETGAYIEITMPFRDALGGTGTDKTLTVKTTAAGITTPPLQPGPATIRLCLGTLRTSTTYKVAIPEGDGSRKLWPIIAAGVLIPADTPADLIERVAQAYFESHGGGGGTGGGTSLTEDPNNPGLYVIGAPASGGAGSTLTEDPANPGLYLIGA